MSEQQLPPEAASTANSTNTTAQQLPAMRENQTHENSNMQKNAGIPTVYLLTGTLAVLLAAQWWTSQTQISGLREELARRLQTGDSINTETKIIAKTVQESSKELQSKVSVLEAKQGEAQNQQLALEQLYQDLSKKP